MLDSVSMSQSGLPGKAMLARWQRPWHNGSFIRDRQARKTSGTGKEKEKENEGEGEEKERERERERESEKENEKERHTEKEKEKEKEREKEKEKRMFNSVYHLAFGRPSVESKQKKRKDHMTADGGS